MATGIISNSFFFEGRRGVSDGLFAINAVAFAWLALITLVCTENLIRIDYVTETPNVSAG
jgi:hypothetical protein